jgi:hypothetical protein
VLNFVTLSIECLRSQHERMEKPTLQEAPYFVLFADCYEVRRGKACTSSMVRRDEKCI